jgi:2-polyprenyl-6-methoxyphenol hydroxylase-like FAD-dependent oxidoreductase
MQASPFPDGLVRFDVVIAGCGPTGAMLAAELRLHDVRVLVVDPETEPGSMARIVGLHIRSIEIMAMRGLLERVREHARQRPIGGIFAGIPKPAPDGLDSTYAYMLGIPQPVLARLLEDRAGELGARIRRGPAVVGFAQDDDGVTVELSDGERVRARHLVGCDGARSTVRKRLGLAFPGEPARVHTLMGELEATAAGRRRSRTSGAPCAPSPAPTSASTPRARCRASATPRGWPSATAWGASCSAATPRTSTRRPVARA